MLSFGEEVEEDEKVAASVNDKIKSIHDVLDDPRFIKEEAQKDEVLANSFFAFLQYILASSCESIFLYKCWLFVYFWTLFLLPT